ncbi:MAG: MaoC family dehydratase [Actinobacteria bacterium]|nr:MaoC family dehydratase [Actinomycetota bacterium]
MSARRAVPIATGESVSTKRLLRQADFDAFAALSGDDNPIHVDPVFAARTRFGRTVSHGMLLYGLICGALSTHFPSTTQLDQSLMFLKPAFAGDEVTVELTVTWADDETRNARLETVVRSAGEVVCEGETTVGWS